MYLFFSFYCSRSSDDIKLIINADITKSEVEKTRKTFLHYCLSWFCLDFEEKLSFVPIVLLRMKESKFRCFIGL